MGVKLYSFAQSLLTAVGVWDDHQRRLPRARGARALRLYKWLDTGTPWV